MKKKTIVSVGFSRKNEISALTRERSRLVFGVVSAFVRFEPLQTGRRFFLLVLSALVVAPYRALAKRLAPGGHWDPLAFVDAVEAAVHYGNPGEIELLQHVQRIEFETLAQAFLA